jgi:hypothetical protein
MSKVSFSTNKYNRINEKDVTCKLNIIHSTKYITPC